MGNPEWPRRKARLLAYRFIELLVNDELSMRDFFDALLLQHNNQAINNALAKAFPELITTPVGTALPDSTISPAGGSRALYIPDLGAYLSFEWEDGRVTRAELS